MVEKEILDPYRPDIGAGASHQWSGNPPKSRGMKISRADGKTFELGKKNLGDFAKVKKGR